MFPNNNKYSNIELIRRIEINLNLDNSYNKLLKNTNKNKK